MTASTTSSAAPVVVDPSTDALIIVDMQTDFLGDAAPLRVPRGAALIPGINQLSRTFTFRHQSATKDWHPAKHCSFQGHGGTWPVHCVQGSRGAALHPELQSQKLNSLIHKGTCEKSDSYSAFADDSGALTGLSGLLRSIGVRRVFVCGVAYDYCVFFTAMDARRVAQLEVVVVSDLCAAIDAKTAQERTEAMTAAGVQIVRSAALVQKADDEKTTKKEISNL